MVSRFENDERENLDIIGSYLLVKGFDKRNPTYGTIMQIHSAPVYTRTGQKHTQ